jgi:N-acetylglucosamine kinase-like BadF-type ATPase
MEALRGVVRAHDGRGPSTALREAVMEQLGLEGPTGLIRWAASASKGEVAALVPLVAGASSAGDAVARSILGRAADLLAGQLAAVLERSGPWAQKPRIALWGGLIWEGGPLRDLLLRAIHTQELTLVERELDPPMGAARRARALTLPDRQ